MGLVLLISTAACIAFAAAVAAVAWEATHPRRRTLAWALARGTPADPSSLDRLESTWRLRWDRLGDGVEMPTWDLDGDDPTGPVVIIVHGWGRSRWDSLRRASVFLSCASRVLLPDLRGHGEATGRTRLGGSEAHDIAHLARQVHQAHLAHQAHHVHQAHQAHLASLSRAPHSASGTDRAEPADSHGQPDARTAVRGDTPRGTPIVLVGHSMGAGVVIRAAVLASAQGREATVEPSNRTDRHGDGASGIIGAVIALAPYERVATPIAMRLRLRALPARILTKPAVILLRCLGVLAQDDEPLSQWAAQLTVPLLVLTAEEDPISPAHDGRTIAAAAAAAAAGSPCIGARSRFELLPGGDHADPGASDVQAYERRLRDFVTSVRPASVGAG